MKRRTRIAGVEDYAMAHRPPGADSGAPLHDLTGNAVYPSDVYSHPQWYDDGSELFSRAFGVAARTRGQPERKVNVYRALPCGKTGIDNGDWVTIIKDYAVQHAKHATDPTKDDCVIHSRAPARCLHTAGDSLLEWGYNCPRLSAQDVVYKPKKKRGKK